MITSAQIAAVVNDIATTFQPERIVLFGSYANGNAHADSDLDILVIMPVEDHPVRTAAKIRQHLPKAFSIDIIVRDDIKVYQDNPDGFISQILQTGKQVF